MSDLTMIFGTAYIVEGNDFSLAGPPHTYRGMARALLNAVRGALTTLHYSHEVKNGGGGTTECITVNAALDFKSHLFGRKRG
jgi:hypothetical protein